MIDTNKKPGREKGRPRAFAVEDAIAAAKAVFCTQGYEGASLATLTQAMGINPPSFYAAFGCKEALFLRVLEDYHCMFEAWLGGLFAERDTALQSLTRLIEETAQQHIAQAPMKGCLIANSAIYACREHEAIARRVQALLAKNEDMICARVERGKREGDVRADIDCRKLAAYVNGLIQAMAVSARAGQSPGSVRAIAETGVQALALLLKS